MMAMGIMLLLVMIIIMVITVIRYVWTNVDLIQEIVGLSRSGA